jgi:PLP dependent protein
MMETPLYATITDNYSKVREKIDRAARQVGREPRTVKLLVVTKGHPVTAVQAAIAGGLQLFGENYAEEGAGKRRACPDLPGIEWHMIGHVQSRKARLVCESFDWVHSLDSLKLAGRLDQACTALNRRLPVLLECNISGEASKSGWPAWNEAGWPDLCDQFRPLLDLPGLDVRGLMTMAPFSDDPEQARPFFQRLARLREFCAARLPGSWDELSMGMSADFEVAVQAGATLVRVGTAILGPRPGVD